MPASVPEVDVKSSLKKRADKRAEDDKAALEAAQERAGEAVPSAHLALHDLFEEIAGQHPDSETDGFNAMADAADMLVKTLDRDSGSIVSHFAPSNSRATIGSDPKVAELEADNERLEADNERLEAEATKASDLQAEIQIKDRRIEHLEGELDREGARKGALASRVSTLEAENERLKQASSGNADQALTDANARITELEEQIQAGETSHAQTLQGKDDEIERLKTDKNRLQQERDAAARVAASLENHFKVAPEHRRYSTAPAAAPTNPTATEPDSFVAGVMANQNPPAAPDAPPHRPSLKERRAAKTAARNGGAE